MPRMKNKRDLATWLVTYRPQIENRMNESLGAAAPSVGAPETEALRRFRTFTGAALLREEATSPALDGLRPNERRVSALLHAWRDAACEVAGDYASLVRETLEPLIQQFRLALRSGASGRQSSGKPRASRRAVIAAIDRISDAFLAVDVSTGRIVDANPAAGALLGVQRDALLEIDAISFVPKSAHGSWEDALEGVAESESEQELQSLMKDIHGETIPVDTRITGFSTRRRTLALVIARPRVATPAEAEASATPETSPPVRPEAEREEIARPQPAASGLPPFGGSFPASS